MSEHFWTIGEVRGLGLVTSVAVAGDIFGMSENTARKAIKLGTFPARTIRCGEQLKVPVAEIVRELGYEPDGLYLPDYRSGRPSGNYPMLAVFNEAREIIGIVDPAAVTPVHQPETAGSYVDEWASSLSAAGDGDPDQDSR